MLSGDKGIDYFIANNCSNLKITEVIILMFTCVVVNSNVLNVEEGCALFKV